MWQRNILLALAVCPLAALGEARYEEAEVVDVEPIVEAVRRIEPARRCWIETVRAAPRAESTTAPLFGALIGGAVGNAVGHKKRNKQVGAVIGALLGGHIAYDIARDAANRPGRTARQEVCETTEKVERVERVVGYMVTYRHQGDIHRARMSKRPGDTIRVRVSVAPVDVLSEPY